MAALLQPRRSRSNRALLEAIVPVGLKSMEKILFFPHPLVFLYRLGSDGRRHFRRIGHLGVGRCCGDGSPCFATTYANSKCAKNKRIDEKSFHCCFKFKLV